MLVLEGSGAADAEEFRAGGIGDFELYEFERDGKRPDGSSIKVAFALAFAADPLAPEAGLFTCRHRYPENFWNPAFQQHANCTSRVAGVVLVAETPLAHRDFLLALAGATSARETDDGLTIDVPRAEIDVITPAAFDRRFGVAAPDTSRGARLAAIRFAGGPGDVKAAMGAVLAFEYTPR